MTRDEIRANRAAWDRWSDGYQRKHGGLLAGEHSEAWGLWRRPESSLRLLDDVAGRSVLELGCGAAHWSRSLGARGADVVGLDLSRRQLAHAASAPSRASFVQGDGEQLPFQTGTFDLVLSDYGALSWCDPAASVPEVGRILRPGGQLVFCTASPIFAICWDPESGTLDPQLRRPYFGLHRRVVAGEATDFHLPFGEWIRLFCAARLDVEQLVEVQPDSDATTTFSDRPLEFARSWPVENIWSLRKRAGS